MLKRIQTMLFLRNGFVSVPPERCTWEIVLSGLTDFIIMAALTAAFAIITLITGL